MTRGRAEHARDVVRFRNNGARPCSDITSLQDLDSSYVYSIHNISYVSMVNWSNRDGLHDELNMRRDVIGFRRFRNNDARSCNDVILLQMSSYVYSTHNISYVSMTS